MNRRQNFQTIAWFNDLHQRGRLDLNPPYQRRSVWNQEYKDAFIDTILLAYPAPAIFLYEAIDALGVATYGVVDGKQRLVTIFDFVAAAYPVGAASDLTALRGKSFGQLDTAQKTAFWSYQFSVEYLPTSDEQIINNIFNRINKNVAKLTPQELRHARFAGEFMRISEELTEWLRAQLPKDFPRITSQTRRQMKDVELIAVLLMLLEIGPKDLSQEDLDQVFSDRDEAWEARPEVESRFRAVVDILVAVLGGPESPTILARSRLRNQADFYSLFGAIDELRQRSSLPPPDVIVDRLQRFLAIVDDEEQRSANETAKNYYEASRSASNDIGRRKKRIETIVEVLTA